MKKRLIFLLLFIVVLSAAIFLFFRGGFREGQVSLKIEAPESITAGEEVEYNIKIENKNKANLRDVKLSFFFPEGSIPLDQEGKPLNSLVNVQDLGILKSKETKEFNLKAVITGERGEIKKAKATLNYTPSNINSVFQKNSETAITINKVDISLTLSAPPNVLPGQRIQLTLDLRNESDKNFEGLQVSFSYPDGFNFKKAIPSPNEGNNIFYVSSLKSAEGKRIIFEGEISGFEKEGKRFTATLKKKIGDKFFDFQKIQTLLTVSTPLLTTDVSVNDQKDFIAKTGDRLRYKIKFSNNSDNNFSALELSAKLEGQMFDFATLKTSGFFNQTSQTILWNAAAEPLLSNLAPNQNGEVFFEVDLKDDFPNVFGAKNYSLKVSAVLETRSVPPDFDLDKISASSDLTTRISSKTSFTSQAFYNNSVFSNSGPVPPKVGQKTTYTIHWKIIDEGNDLTNVKIISSLLPGITFENKTKVTPTQSNLEYNPSTGRISWDISTVPAGSGTVSSAFEAVFQVGITPSVNQVGQAAEIIKETTFEAVDNFTKGKIILNQLKITTQTIADSPGVVRQ